MSLVWKRHASENTSHTYTFREVKITNLDIGMTPVYLPSKMDDKYSQSST